MSSLTAVGLDVEVQRFFRSGVGSLLMMFLSVGGQSERLSLSVCRLADAPSFTGKPQDPLQTEVSGVDGFEEEHRAEAGNDIAAC